jgi:hypothetical protein
VLACPDRSYDHGRSERPRVQVHLPGTRLGYYSRVCHKRHGALPNIALYRAVVRCGTQNTFFFLSAHTTIMGDIHRTSIMFIHRSETCLIGRSP